MTARRSQRLLHPCARGASALAVVAACTGAASVAHADPPSFAERHPDLKAPDLTNETKKEYEARRQRGAEAFALGKAALARGDFKTCEQMFAKVWMLTGRESINTAANLGQCESQLGYYLDAREHLTFALRGMEAERNDPKRAEQIAGTEEELKTAEAHLAILSVASAPVDAVLSIGGKITLAAPFVEKVALYPGDHVVEVRIRGELVRKEKLHAEAGMAYAYRYYSPKPPPPPPVPPGPRVLWLALGGASAGAFAALGAGMLFGWQDKNREAAGLRDQIGAVYGGQVGACAHPVGERVSLCQSLDATTDSAAIFQYAGIASLVVGGLIGAGTTAYGVWPRPKAAAPAPPATDAPAPFVLSARVVAGPGTAGLMIQGAW